MSKQEYTYIINSGINGIASFGVELEQAKVELEEYNPELIENAIDDIHFKDLYVDELDLRLNINDQDKVMSIESFSGRDILLADKNLGEFKRFTELVDFLESIDENKSYVANFLVFPNIGISLNFDSIPDKEEIAILELESITFQPTADLQKFISEYL